jgi:hypothetical protein
MSVRSYLPNGLEPCSAWRFLYLGLASIIECQHAISGKFLYAVYAQLSRKRVSRVNIVLVNGYTVRVRHVRRSEIEHASRAILRVHESENSLVLDQ